ncbi:hypothetical protein FOZ61_000873, partial [Perkinsus olseni]
YRFGGAAPPTTRVLTIQRRHGRLPLEVLRLWEQFPIVSLTSPYLGMATIQTLLLPLLVATAFAFRIEYQYNWSENYRITFDFDPSSDIKIKTECFDPSGPHGRSPYSTKTSTFPIDGGRCFHYYHMTLESEAMFESYRKDVKKSCGLSLPKKAFHDIFLFSGLLVINLDQKAQLALKPVG